MSYETAPHAHKYKTWAEIDLDALRGNYRIIRDFVSQKTPGCRVACVVKADAYGHGADACTCALYDEGADVFAVSCTDEALSLRSALDKSGRTRAQILILGYTSPEDADLLITYRITQTIFSAENAQAFSVWIDRYKESGKIPADARLDVHVKLDTGMNRIGFDAESPACAAEILSAVTPEHFHLLGVFTHFACADEPQKPMTARQYEKYDAVTQALRAAGSAIGVRHVCNSAAMLTYPAYHLDMVRAGILLYGLPPAPGLTLPGIRPVMRLCTTVSHIHTLRCGESVSYGATFTAARDLRIATLPIGYADGFVRGFSSGGAAVVGGRCAPIVGRVCMDQCMIDVTDIPVAVGDTVVLFGNEPGEIERLAGVANTINYELVCLVGKRVPRFYR